MTRRTAVAGVGWAGAAVVATLIGMGGIRLIGDSLTSTPGGVLDQEDVAKALAVSPSAASGSASPETSNITDKSPIPTASEPSAGRQRGFSSPGGSVVAGCRDGHPYLVSWSPAAGYRVTKQETESEHADVRFEGSGGRSEIRVTCSGGDPVEQQRD
jgi:hypothetical protein